VTDGRLQIEFQRTGGFAGAILSTSVDAGELPQAEATELRDLVDRANLPSLAQRGRGGPGKPDRFQYDLTIEDGDRRYQVSLGETEVPEACRPLLDRLLEMARRR
jgi:hypothetical protein